jgi:hypothetical protein
VSYRKRLRATEAERDQLREQLDRLQTAEAERLAGASGLAAPSDLWQFGATLDTLRGEDGALDQATVEDKGTVMVWTDAEREWMMRDEPGAVRCPAVYNHLRRHGPKPEVLLCCLMRVDHPGRHIAIADRRWPQQVEEPGLRTVSGLPITDEFVAGVRALVGDQDFQARLRHARERNREALGEPG